jgi:hypothetical protein
MKRKKKTRNDKDPRLERAYKGQDGVVFYTFKNISDIPATRAVNAQAAARYAEMLLTKDDLTAFLNTLAGHLEAKEYSKIAAQIENMKVRNELVCEKNTLLDIAALYFLYENETPETVLESVTQSKVERWKADQAEANFFLLRVIGYIESYSQYYERDLIGYLQRTNEAATKTLNNISLISQTSSRKA